MSGGPGRRGAAPVRGAPRRYAVYRGGDRSARRRRGAAVLCAQARPGFAAGEGASARTERAGAVAAARARARTGQRPAPRALRAHARRRAAARALAPAALRPVFASGSVRFDARAGQYPRRARRACGARGRAERRCARTAQHVRPQARSRGGRPRARAHQGELRAGRGVQGGARRRASARGQVSLRAAYQAREAKDGTDLGARAASPGAQVAVQAGATRRERGGRRADAGEDVDPRRGAVRALGALPRERRLVGA